MPPGGVPGGPEETPRRLGHSSLFAAPATDPSPPFAPSPPPTRRRGVAWRGVWTRLRAPRPSERQPATPRLRLFSPSHHRAQPHPLVPPPRPGVAQIKCDLHLKPAPRFAPSWGSRGCAVGTQCSLHAGLCWTALSLLPHLGCAREGLREKRGAALRATAGGALGSRKPLARSRQVPLRATLGPAREVPHFRANSDTCSLTCHMSHCRTAAPGRGLGPPH